jgi:hypothetical protein
MAELAMTVAALLPATPVSFDGAVIRLFGTEILIVMVTRKVFLDGYESSLLVAAFHARFKRTVVLATRDRMGATSYFGPVPIARALAKLPIEALAWRRYRYRREPVQLLPIPIDGGDATDSHPSWTVCDTPDTALVAPTRALRASSQETRALRK